MVPILIFLNLLTTNIGINREKKYRIISVEGTQGNDPFDIILTLGKELIQCEEKILR